MINIIKDIYIDADENCLMLVVWDGKMDKKGNPQNAQRLFYSDFASLLTGLYKILTRKAVKSLTALDELSVEMAKIKSIITDFACRFDGIVSQAISTNTKPGRE